jgi:uncharacterized protein YggE
VVDIDLGISVLGDVREATATAAEKAAALIESLVAAGLERDNITTTDYSIHPEYDYSSNQQRLLGYRVTNTMRARARDLEATGSILDTAAAAAGDAFRVNGIRFDIEDEAPLAGAARAAAWEDALSKANQLAELAGLRLGSATTIREVLDSPPVPVFRQKMLAAEAAQTPIEPGTATVAVTIQVEFALEG